MDLLLQHLGPFLLVFFRLTGLFVFAPALSSPVVPARVRVIIAAALALVLYPALPDSARPAAALRIADLDVVMLALAVATETLVGLVIGLIAALPMYAVQLGGLIMGQQMGLGLANIYNPALDIEGDVVGQLLIYLAVAIFLSLGGLDAAFIALANSFSHTPPAAILSHQLAPFAHASLHFISGLVASGLELALRISAPVLCIILLETVATAFIMKTMPQLNIMSLGFATKVLGAFIALVLALASISHVVAADIDRTMRDLLDFASALGASDG